MAGQHVQIAGLGGGLGGDGPAAAQRQVAAAGAAFAAARGRGGQAHIGFCDLGPGLDALGHGLDGFLGPGAGLGVAGQRHPAAGGFEQDVEGVLDQGRVTAVGARDRPHRLLRQGQELSGVTAQASANAGLRSSVPVRLPRPAAAMATGAIWPTRSVEPSIWTGCR